MVLYKKLDEFENYIRGKRVAIIGLELVIFL